ncbi:MAG: ribose 5-phosphate isomerase B [Phycisphaerae bacterium]
MKIALACDHRGFNLRTPLQHHIHSLGHELLDFGVHDARPCDYPDYAVPAAIAVVKGEAQRAILIDGSGIGMAIVANKVPGIRAATCHDELTAEISRRYNDANVLCLAADLLGEELIRRIVRSWLGSDFEQGRHTRRLEKIAELEGVIFPECANTINILANRPKPA